MLKLIVHAILLQAAACLIAYDCGHEKMNQTRISLLSVDKCKLDVPNITHIEEDIQLLELNEVTTIQIYQCKINVLQSIFRCGMFSHLSLVPGGLSTFIADISKEECMEIHKLGTYKLPNHRVLTGIKANSSSRYTEIIAGTVDSSGRCSGTTYIYGSNSWDNVIVTHAIEINIEDYTGTVRLEDNQVVLRNNILCSYMKDTCIDPDKGMSFWEMIPDTSCESLSYSVLYEGNATKVQNFDTNQHEIHTVYTVTSGEIIFALEITKDISVCRYKGFQTEHPRLMIVVKSGHDYWFPKKPINMKNLDLFTYINTKFVYVERHIKKQIQTVYTHLIQKKCELEKQVLETQLAVAHNHPAEFAFMRMKEPGYTAVSRGEIIYLIRCQAVETSVRKTERCFNELPVIYNNQSYFMAPSTHLLQKFGTEIPCSSTLTSAYLIHGNWYGFNPHSHRLENPESLKPTKEVQWKYDDPQKLIKSGIYSFETTDELRRQIMYPTERKAIENVLTKAIIGHDVDRQDVNVLNLLTTDHVDQISSYLQKTWSIFNGLGNLTASLIAVWYASRLIKYIISLIINLRIIRVIHGWNWWLLAAICNSCTTFVIHRHTQRKNPTTDIQLTSVTTDTNITDLTENETTANTTTPSGSTASHTDTSHLESLRRHNQVYPTLKV